MHELIYSRYELLELIGSGTFGKVIKAIDVNTGKLVAVKAIRSVTKYREAAKYVHHVIDVSIVVPMRYFARLLEFFTM